MIILAVNQTTSDIMISDLAGTIIPVNGSLDLALNFTLDVIANSNDLLTLIADNSLVINNGLSDFDKATALRYVCLFKHVNPVSPDGKEIIRAESRPEGTESYFTTTGDDGSIGGGKSFFWEFDNNDDIILSDSTSIGHHNYIPEGFKRKRMILTFQDGVYIKGGKLYFSSALKGSYADFYIVVPAGYYYYARNGDIAYAFMDAPIIRYVNRKYFFGTTSSGDKVSAEGCQVKALPVGWELWGDITVPIEDTSSFGHCELEMYRIRSYLYPDEKL
jgi:hypothetical protein